MISNLPPLVDEATLLVNVLPILPLTTLQARFEKYGPVLQIKVIRKRSTGCSSYGFVVFRSKEHADQAVVKENGMLWMTKRICVIYAKSESVCDFEIIISHLPLSFSEEQTRAIFSQVCLATATRPLRPHCHFSSEQLLGFDSRSSLLPSFKTAI
jgi:hypothetical protein